jgi:hypothetical protein
LLCVEDDDSTIFGTKNCTQRGHQSRLFSQIDTGRQKIAWFQLDLTSVQMAREAICNVRVRMRRSLLDQNTQVMMLRNVHPHYISFNLRYYKRSGQSSLLPISIEGSKTTEVGFVQGWTGNFVSGERCEAYFFTASSYGAIRSADLLLPSRIVEQPGKRSADGVSRRLDIQYGQYGVFTRYRTSLLLINVFSKWSPVLVYSITLTVFRSPFTWTHQSTPKP